MKLPGEELKLHSPGKFFVSDASQLSYSHSRPRIQEESKVQAMDASKF
jgi:hypothetical protein